MAAPIAVENETAPLFEHPAASSALTIVASYRQKGNPLIPFLKDLRIEYGNIVPDYLLSTANAVLFISLKYHRQHPAYLASRIAELKRHYRVRIMLCLVDLPDFQTPLENVTHQSFQSALTLFLAWSPTEAARIIQYFKHLEDKPPDCIQGRLGTDIHERAIDLLTTISSVNKTDCATLMGEFGSFKALMKMELICRSINSGLYLLKDKYRWNDRSDVCKMAFYTFLLLPVEKASVSNEKLHATDKLMNTALTIVRDWEKYGVDRQQIDSITKCDVDIIHGRTIAMKFVQLGLTTSIISPFAQSILFTHRTLAYVDGKQNNIVHLAAMSEDENTFIAVMKTLYKYQLEASRQDGQQPIDLVESDSLRELFKNYYGNLSMFATFQEKAKKELGYMVHNVETT